MTSFEKSEIRRIPKKYRPIGAWGYLWLSILYGLPVIGFILTIMHSISDRKICRRSFARFMLIGYILAVVSIVALIALGMLSLSDFEEFANQLPSDI